MESDEKISPCPEDSIQVWDLRYCAGASDDLNLRKHVLNKGLRQNFSCPIPFQRIAGIVLF